MGTWCWSSCRPTQNTPRCHRLVGWPGLGPNWLLSPGLACRPAGWLAPRTPLWHGAFRFLFQPAPKRVSSVTVSSALVIGVLPHFGRPHVFMPRVQCAFLWDLVQTVAVITAALAPLCAVGSFGTCRCSRPGLPTSCGGFNFLAPCDCEVRYRSSPQGLVGRCRDFRQPRPIAAGAWPPLFSLALCAP